MCFVIVYVFIASKMLYAYVMKYHSISATPKPNNFKTAHT